MRHLGDPISRRLNRPVGWYLPDGGYSDKVLGYGPIAYWPLYEMSGTTAECLVNSAQNGTYSSDVSGWPVGDGIGDGNTAPVFDGSNDYIDVFSATLQSAFNGDEGTAMIWCRAINAAMWTDGVVRFSLNIIDFTDWNEYIWLYKSGDNSYRWRFHSGGADSIRQVTMSPTAWFHVLLTWSASANEVIAYLDGVQQGATLTVPGAWAGTIDRAYIGAQSNVPATPWHGPLAHCALWDSPLAQSVVTDLASV